MCVTVSRLDNGLTVVSDHMSHVKTVSLGLWVKAGARFETEPLNGISHFLEHMFFKGTQSRTATDIAEQIEDVGGSINAYTGREITAYYVKMLKEHANLGLDILADVLRRSTFPEEEMLREKDVVLQEISQSLDTPEDVLFDLFQNAAFPDHPLGRPILGTADHVKSLTRETLSSYARTHYTPERMVLAAAGNIDHDTLLKQAEDLFGDMMPGTDQIDPPTARFKGGSKTEARPLEQLQFALGFEGLNHADPDYYAAAAMTTALGGGMSSRLFQEIREKRGLVYSVYSFATGYTDSGLFGIYAGTAPDACAELVPALCDELIKATDGFTEQETTRACTQIKAGILMSLESTSARCEQLARHIFVYGRPLPLEEITAKIDALAPADLTRVARRIFREKPIVTAVGDLSALEDFQATDNRFTPLREG